MDALKEASIERIKQLPDGKVISTEELIKETGSWGK